MEGDRSWATQAREARVAKDRCIRATKGRCRRRLETQHREFEAKLKPFCSYSESRPLQEERKPRRGSLASPNQNSSAYEKLGRIDEVLGVEADGLDDDSNDTDPDETWGFKERKQTTSPTILNAPPSEPPSRIFAKTSRTKNGHVDRRWSWLSA
ncbi:hypothetical protein J3F84DRAFT_188501 [Trichoderma pleuroticola]